MNIDFSTVDFDISTKNVELNKISLRNEMEYSFPFKDLTFVKDEKEVKYHVIKIDYGDGSKETFTEPIKSPVSYLEIYQPDWDEISHEFSFESGDETEIKIEFYFITGDIFTITIPVEVILNSLSDIGTNFQLLSASLTNDDRVSYVLKHSNTDSIIIVHSIKEMEKAKRS